MPRTAKKHTNAAAIEAVILPFEQPEVISIATLHSRLKRKANQLLFTALGVQQPSITEGENPSFKTDSNYFGATSDELYIRSYAHSGRPGITLSVHSPKEDELSGAINLRIASPSIKGGEDQTRSYYITTTSEGLVLAKNNEVLFNSSVPVHTLNEQEAIELAQPFVTNSLERLSSEAIVFAAVKKAAEAEAERRNIASRIIHQSFIDAQYI